MTYTHYAAFLVALAVASWLVHALLMERGRNQLRKAWRIAQDVAMERETARDIRGALAADEVCARIEKELGL